MNLGETSSWWKYWQSTVDAELHGLSIWNGSIINNSSAGLRTKSVYLPVVCVCVVSAVWQGWVFAVWSAVMSFCLICSSNASPLIGHLTVRSYTMWSKHPSSLLKHFLPHRFLPMCWPALPSGRNQIQRMPFKYFFAPHPGMNLSLT